MYTYPQVMSKLQAEATGLKGHIVSALLSASYTHIQAGRALQGTSLLHAHQPSSTAQRLLAAVSLALTAPLYALAQKLVFSKVRRCAGVCWCVLASVCVSAVETLLVSVVGTCWVLQWGICSLIVEHVL